MTDLMWLALTALLFAATLGYARICEHDYPATILERADKALYFAKEHGRNCVHGFEALTAQGLLGGGMLAGSIDLF